MVPVIGRYLMQPTRIAGKDLPAGVVVAPGRGYGPGGEGYIRISLTVADERLAEAMDRVSEAVRR